MCCCDSELTTGLPDLYTQEVLLWPRWNDLWTKARNIRKASRRTAERLRGSMRPSFKAPLACRRPDITTKLFEHESSRECCFNCTLGPNDSHYITHVKARHDRSRRSLPITSRIQQQMEHFGDRRVVGLGSAQHHVLGQKVQGAVVLAQI